MAFWPKEAVLCYEQILKDCGAKTSKGKHYVSDIGRGVFTEKPFTLGTVRCKPFRYSGKREVQIKVHDARDVNPNGVKTHHVQTLISALRLLPAKDSLNKK